MKKGNGIFITGGTGFLGIHIIKELLQNEKSVIYCLVRGKNLADAKESLRKKLMWYFSSEWEQMLSKIHVICGDFTQDNLGLSREDYEQLTSEVSQVIHAGAIVKHFGKKEEYEKTNVNGTRKIVEFCRISNAYLLYTSSVAVLSYTDNSEKEWSYQNEEHVDLYVKSKIESEKIIQEAVENGLKASIIRIGALSGRYSDGTLQENIDENAVNARIKTMVVSGKLPSRFLDSNVELLPVDICSEMIVFIARSRKEGYFCIYNNNTVTYQQLIDLLIQLGYHVETFDYKDYISFYKDVRNDSLNKALLTGFFLHYRRRRNNQKTKKKFQCEVTEKYLRENNLEYPHITTEYVAKILQYMKKIEYIEVEKEG